MIKININNFMMVEEKKYLDFKNQMMINRKLKNI